MSKNTSPDHPGTYVKKSVIPKGISVTKAAEMMGIGRPALSNFLNSNAGLSMNMAIRLEKTFGVKKEELFALQQEYDSFINKEEEKRIAVKSYTPSFLKITATHIESWAEKIEARSLLPVLLRRLVNSTGGEIIKSDFPGYDKSQTPGWDGIVESNNATPWIPSGLSGWEFGCDKVPKGKADKEYQNRINSTPESERANISFIFVTPRSWSQKKEWIKKAKEKNDWKDVRAFDAGDLEQWLEASVPTQVWLAEQLGIPKKECQSLSDYWLFWSQTAEPAISPKIFKSAILDYGGKLKNWYLNNPDRPFILVAASKEEAKAFLCCCAEKVDELKPLVDQAIFISLPEMVKRLSLISKDFIPVVYTDEAQKELVGSFGKRHSIIISERNLKKTEADICLDLPNYESFKEALDDMGFDEAHISVYANQSGYSPTILRRLLAKTPALKKPEWATSTERIKTIAPLVLAGAWSTTMKADKEILSCLANKSYPEIEKDIAELANIDDSPLWSEGKYRGVVSKLECIYAISDQLTEDDVNNFFDLAEYVLSEDDPALDLEKENRWAANIYNKVRDHSYAIRESICQNLIILAVHGNGLLGQRLGLDIERMVSILIKTLLRDKDNRAWQAQQGDLPLYAEAAPDMFLSIVEEELQKEPPAFNVLFEPVESGMFSRCERTGMLWALELLAWTPNLLPRAVKVLAKLSEEYDLDDNWSNKPINSLKDILLSWKPHTAASIEQRCEVLEMLCSQYPKIGWEICVQPLKQRNSFTSGTYRPRWRSDASGAGETVTYGEIRKYGLKCLEIILSWPSHTLETLKDLVSCLPSMGDDDKKKVVEQIKAWVECSPKEEDIIELREHVRTRTMTTRALKNSKNINGKNYVCGKELYELLKPRNLILKHQWLFGKRWVEFTPEELEKDNLDFDDREKWLSRQRVNALREIISERHISGIINLLKKSGSGFTIGMHLHNDILGKTKISEFILACLSADGDDCNEFDNCVSGILFQMEEDEREQLNSNLINKLSSEPDKEDKISRLFLCSPFCRNTWEQLERQEEEVKIAYWLKIHPGWANLSPEDLNFAVGKLLDMKRPLVAFNLAHYKINDIESKYILMLLNAIANNAPGQDGNYKPSQHNIEQALNILNERDDFDRIELIKLEYLYVDILHSHSSYGIPNLSKEISESPLFFMQLMAYGFKRNDGGNDPSEWNIPKDEEAKGIAAMKAYNILECINVIPGTLKDGSIDVRKLREWIKQVRKLAKEHGREDITDQQIGKLLSVSSSDDDGIWPRKEIREVFEEVGSSEISIGMEIGLYNSVGAEFRAVDSSRERATAKKYREMATKAINKTPFVGKMLNRIADRYDRDADSWAADHRVNKRLRGW